MIMEASGQGSSSLYSSCLLLVMAKILLFTRNQPLNQCRADEWTRLLTHELMRRPGDIQGSRQDDFIEAKKGSLM